MRDTAKWSTGSSKKAYVDPIDPNWEIVEMVVKHEEAGHMTAAEFLR